ncbi:Serum paraoxonase/arylesterase 2 [Mycena indigotica]|uniref:Serum paraoxonase/arylesterase 2 n=1 Tax=Mycena indigotica TaxID=2126181 RepID=A0A8H6SI68_9AGAR|nr:Serum paraoxonase/arylesterase 2 [Mycena indigotica]KAF7299393.1 Serum paraoxonase/arylesterase 2 [Mycena indigotica]
MSRLVQLSIVLAALAAGYQLWLQPIFTKLGVWRVIEPINNTNCRTVPELAACESTLTKLPFHLPLSRIELVLHQATGLLFLACSSPESRAHWVPAVGQLNVSGPDAELDYLATYDAATNKITRLELPIPIHTHGMDVVPAGDGKRLFIYAVNHRKGKQGDGADSTIEVLSLALGETKLNHLRTVRHPIVLTPNDVVGSDDGKSVFFTNDHASKTSWTRHLSLLGFESGSVGFCSIPSGEAVDCKTVAPDIHGANGITRSRTNDTFFVANALFGGITVLERQHDNTLLKTHVIPTDRGLDNLSMDNDGVVYGAGIPSIPAISAHIANPSLKAPSSVLAVSKNVGPGSFYGEKFVVKKVFEDDGSLARGTTSVVHDSARGKLFIHGIAAPHLTYVQSARSLTHKFEVDVTSDPSIMPFSSQLDDGISPHRRNLVPSHTTAVSRYTTSDDATSVQEWNIVGYRGIEGCPESHNIASASIPQLVEARRREDGNDMVSSLVRYSRDLPADICSRGSCHWAQCLVPEARTNKSVVEMKLDVDFITEEGQLKVDKQSINAAIQLATSARSLLVNSGDTHVYVSAVFQHKSTRIYRFDRCGFKASPAFEWNVEPRPVVTLVHRLFVPQTLGDGWLDYVDQDDTISSASPEEKKRLWTALCADEFYKTIIADEAIFNYHCQKFIASHRIPPNDPHGPSQFVTCLQIGPPLSQSDGPFSHATRVYRVAILEDLPALSVYALKDAWKQGYRRDEIDLYDSIAVYVQSLDDLEKFDQDDQRTKKAKAFGMAECHGMINLAEGYDENQVPWKWRPELHRTSDGASSEDNGRYHTRALITPVGCPLNKFPSTKALCKGIQTACFQHQVAYHAGVQHCDLNEGNLMFDEKTMTWEFPQLFVIGWDYAEFVDGDGIDGAALFQQNFPERTASNVVVNKEPTRFTGTLPFMALELLRSKALHTPVAHKAHHDIESLFWIQIWMLTRYTNYFDTIYPHWGDPCNHIFGSLDGLFKHTILSVSLMFSNNTCLFELCDQFRAHVAKQNPPPASNITLLPQRSKFKRSSAELLVHFFVEDIYDLHVDTANWPIGDCASTFGSGQHRVRVCPTDVHKSVTSGQPSKSLAL